MDIGTISSTEVKDSIIDEAYLDTMSDNGESSYLFIYLLQAHISYPW